MITLAWSVANKTDGYLEFDDLAMIPQFLDDNALEFERKGLWAPRSDGWFIIDFPSTQTSKLQLEGAETARAAAKAKKQNQRAKTRNSYTDALTGDVPRDSTRPGLGKGLGQGQGQGEGQGQGQATEDLGTKIASLFGDLPLDPR